jgi:predicted helicase
MEHIVSANSWKEFEHTLEALSTTEKGRAFEELTRLYLLTDSTFTSKITNLWLHSEVPQRVVDDLELQHPEIGVDFISQVNDGSYWAIQCKFHQDRTKNVTYDELGTFFSITERNKTYKKLSHRLVCTSSNGISRKVYNAHPEKLGYITSSEFSKLGQNEFDLFREFYSDRRIIYEPHMPRIHQRIALENSNRYFNNVANTRGKIIHPCGSGKTLTGFWISRSLNAKTVLIAVPSLALVRQTLNVWTREAYANNVDMDWMVVCSDDGISRSDDPEMRTVDLGIQVNNNPDSIAKFLSDNTTETKVLITTYQSGHAVSQGVQMTDIVFDLAIYDEAHKTVGRRDKPFAHLLYDENVRVSKRVFMTATEREFKGDSVEVLSMDDEETYGPTIDQLSFKKAIEQTPPILSDYKIVSTFVTKTEIQELMNRNDLLKPDGSGWTLESDASTFASLIALRKLIDERDIKHVVSFHSSIRRSKEFMDLNVEASKVSGAFGILTPFHVSGKYSTGDRTAIIERFMDVEPSLVTNARCLTEGVDVPAIDAVLFADPKQSKIDIVQAAGRALRMADNKAFGYILLPIVIEDDGADLSHAAFGQIISVLSALGMHDERIVEEFKTLVSGKRDHERIVEFNLPNTSTSINFNDFLSNIEILVWDRLSFAKSVIGETNFTKWMRENTNLSEKSLKNYSQAIRKISNDLVRLKLTYSSLEELMQSEDLYTLKKEYFNIPEYRALDERGKGMYSAGFNKLIEYHQAKNS